MDVRQFLAEINRLPAAGYQPYIFTNHGYSNAIRLGRKGRMFCPLGALSDYKERRTLRGGARRFIRYLRARWHSDASVRSANQGMIQYGPLSWARSYANEALAMQWPDTDAVVTAADGLDESVEKRYDRPTRAAMLKALGLSEATASA